MELMLLEQQVQTFVSSLNLDTKEKTRRTNIMLDFIVGIYNKHGEELNVDEAYNILFEEPNELS